MAYKALGDRVRRDALPAFLDNASLLVGNLVVVLVDRRISTLFSDPGDRRLLPELVVAVRGWSERSFRRLLTMSSLGALLLAGLAGTHQDILWVSDQDEIAPNTEKHTHAGHVMSHCIEKYAPDFCGELCFVTTEGDFDSRFREDLVALPDLAAGALVDAYTKSTILGSGAGDRRLLYPPGASIPQKANDILQWLGQTDSFLKSMVVLLDLDGIRVNSAVFRPTLRDGRVFCLA